MRNMESKKLVENLDRTRVDGLIEKGLPKGEYWASIGKTPWGDTPHKLRKGKKGKKGKRKESVGEAADPQHMAFRLETLAEYSEHVSKQAALISKGLKKTMQDNGDHYESLVLKPTDELDAEVDTVDTSLAFILRMRQSNPPKVAKEAEGTLGRIQELHQQAISKARQLRQQVQLAATWTGGGVWVQDHPDQFRKSCMKLGWLADEVSRFYSTLAKDAKELMLFWKGKGESKVHETRFITVPGTALSVGDTVNAQHFFHWTSGASRVVKVQPRSAEGHVDVTIEDEGDKYVLMFHPGTTVLKMV